MDNLTPEEINRRVAEACGWSGLENADACIAEMFPYPDKHLNLKELVEATASGWFGWAPDAKGPSSVGGEPYDGADKEPTPDFSRDPAAADLVRLEIERRRWLWRVGRTEFGYDAILCTRNTWYAGQDSKHRVINDNGNVWEALCLAFLEADAAQKEAASE